MSGTRLVFLGAAGQASPYIIVDDEGEIAVRGAFMPGDTAPAMRTVLVVPGSAVLARWIALPACTPVQAAAAAAHLLKDDIAVTRDSVHIAVGPAGQPARLVCVVAKDAMRSFLARAGELGIAPDCVVPDHLMLPASDSETVLATLRGGMVVARGRNLAFSAEPDLAWLLIGKSPMQAVERERDIEHLFAAMASMPAINLLQQEFAHRAGRAPVWRDFRRAAALAAAVLLSPLVLSGADIARNEFSARALEARAATAARAVAGVGDAADPVLTLKGRLADLRGGDRFLQTTALLFDAVQRMNGAELESLSYLSEGVIRATLVDAAPEAIAALRTSMAEKRIALEQDAATRREGRSLTTITMKPNP